MAKREKQPHGGVLQKWEPGESGNPKGRPRNLLRQIAEAAGVDFSVSISENDKRRIIESMLELSLERLGKIATNKDTPAFMVVIANAIRTDVKDGTMTTVNSLFDRLYGRPAATLNLDMPETGERVPMEEYTDAEVVAEAKRLSSVLAVLAEEAEIEDEDDD